MSTNSNVVPRCQCAHTHSGVFARSPRAVPFAVSPDAHAVVSLRIGERVLRHVTRRGGVVSSLSCGARAAAVVLRTGSSLFVDSCFSSRATVVGTVRDIKIPPAAAYYTPVKWSGRSTTMVETVSGESSGAPLLYFISFFQLQTLYRSHPSGCSR